MKNRSGCPVNISLEVFGDRWSLLIVRDLMVRGFTTFQDFLRSGEGIATNILADRLKRLQKAGIVAAEKDEEDRRKVNYRLTEKGIDLAPVMLELLIWGARHERTEAPSAVVTEMARNRRAVLTETRRRWQERNAQPMLPWLGGPAPRPQGAARTTKRKHGDKKPASQKGAAMKTVIFSSRIVALVLAALATAVAHTQAQSMQMQAQKKQAPYSRMAPLDQYLIADRNAEIALARSGAPASISDKAEVMVLGRNGFEVAVQGTNGFVCLVERSWDAAIGDPVFWNPKIRGPNCFNAAAARSYLPIAFMKTRLALAGKTQAQIDAAMQTAFNQKKLPALEPGAMCYMLSKDGYLNDQARNWHPHLMFFVPLSMSKTWGANLAASPVLSGDDASDRLTIFMVPVARWSDGTADANAGN